MAPKLKFGQPGYAQQMLIEYLNQKPDPYDFPWLMEDWNRELAEEVANEIDALAPKQRAAFTKWLQADAQQTLIHSEAAETMGAEAPSYLYFGDARAVAPKSWFIHFTNESPFLSFEYGAPGTILGLTTHFRDRKRNRVHCPENMTGELGLYETLYGFAFDLSSRSWRGKSRKYGRNAVIFQHDYALGAHHHGDEEFQVIFPLCGEYNVVPVYNVNSEGGGLVDTDGGEVDFDSWHDIVNWVERGRPSKLGLGAVAPGHSYWAPGVRVKRGTFLGLVRE